MCQHNAFEADVQVKRTSDETGEMMLATANVRVRCKECGQEFEFTGLDEGSGVLRPGTSAGGREARLPIVPGDGAA